MNALECAGVTKSFGPVLALDGADVVVAPGSLTAILGPSGCGKSTLLRVIAGFERPDAGTVSIKGQVVAGPGVHVPPERRRAGIVPQEQALFPHLSVAANVAYGLGRGGRAGLSPRVAAMLELCGLPGLGNRMPHELSGGQQQRVALARALAPEPSVVLLDEPFASLDATLRAGLRVEIAAILRAAGQTALLVTHDQDEALSIADSVAVMRSGRIVQHAAPAEVYRHPADAWVAGFVGSANVLDGDMVEPGLVKCALGTMPVAVAGAQPHDSGVAVKVVVRPEQVVLGEATGGVAGTVERREYHGHDSLVWVELGDGTRLMARILSGGVPEAGARVSVSCHGEAVVFPAG
ncbi:MAG: ABC transporter ATP-binding protein [Acidimicrobiales bacterium]